MEEILVLKLKLDASATIRTQDDLIARNKELAKLLRQAPLEGEEGYDQLSESIAKTSEEFAKNRQRIEKFNKELRETETATGSINELQRELRTLEQQYRELGAEQRETFGPALRNQIATIRTEIRNHNRDLRETDVAADSMKGLSRQLRELETEYKQLTKAQRETFGAELAENIASVRAELSGLEQNLGDYRRNVGNYPWFDEDGLFSFKSAIAGVGAVAAAAFTFDAAKQVVQEIADVTKEFKILRGEIELFTDASGTDLDEFASRTSAIVATYGGDQKAVIEAANAVSKNFGISFGESLELISEGYRSGADANGQLLDSLKEYPVVLKETGLTARDTVALIRQGALEGIFSDKLIDTIKEADLSLKELTKTQLDALAPLGTTFVDELTSDINTGSINTIEAIQRIASKADEVGLSVSQIQTITADVFKGAGEDAGGFENILRLLNQAQEEGVEISGEYAESLERRERANKALADAQNETAKNLSTSVGGFANFNIILKTFLFTYLNGIIDAFKPLIKAFKNLFGILISVGKELGLITGEGDLLQKVVDGLTFFMRKFGSQLARIVNLLARIVSGIIDFVKRSKFLTVAISGIINFASTLITIFGNIPATFSGVTEAVKQLATNFTNFFKETLSRAREFTLQVQKALTIKKSARDEIQAQIDELKAKRSEIEKSGRSIGEAFNDGFVKAIADQEAQRALNDSGNKFGSGFVKSFNAAIVDDDPVIKIADDIVIATEEVLASGSIAALQEQVKKVSEELDKTSTSAENYKEVAQKVIDATKLLEAAQEMRRLSLLSESELLDEITKKEEERLQKAAATVAAKITKESEALKLQTSEAISEAQSRRDALLDNEKLTADGRKQIYEDYEAEVRSLELQGQQSKLALLTAGSQEFLDLQRAIKDEEAAINQEAYDKDLEAFEATELQKQEMRNMFRDMAIGAAQQLSDGVFGIVNDNIDRETDEKLSKLDEETEAKLESARGSEERQTEIKKEAEAKRDKIEKEQAKKRQKVSITQAIINGALAAVQALANTTLPFPLSLTALIPVALTTALNIANIRRQKFAKGGIAKGKTHAQGGIPAIVGGTTPIEVENNEAWINAKSTRKYTQHLSDINQAEGGVRFEGTKKLTPERKRQISLFSMMQNVAPKLAKYGLSPRLPSKLGYHKFELGGIASNSGVSLSDKVISSADFARIEAAVERGAKRGIESARILEQYARQLEREQELENRANV